MEKEKLPLLTNNMTVYVENPEESPKKLLQFKRKLSLQD